MQLWRPVGLSELALIYGAAMKAFPPRLPGQDIFYPVLNPEYADQIARDWNATTAPFAGYVVRFHLPDDYAKGFGPHVVGAPNHEELWIPSSQLEEMNGRIEGSIQVIRAFFGKDFVGYVPSSFGLKGVSALDQLGRMLSVSDDSGFDFLLEIGANSVAFFLNYPFWASVPGARLRMSDADRDRALRAVEKAWAARPRCAPLPAVGCTA